MIIQVRSAPFWWGYGAVADYLAAGFREEDEEENHEDAAEDGEEPEY